MDAPSPCLNCGAAGSDRYCPRCGQSREPVRKSLWLWLRDLLDEQFSLDGRLPRTIGALLFRPGKLTAEWIAGRRTAYVPPLRLLLLALVALLGVAFTVELGTIRSGFNDGYVEARAEDGASVPYWGPDTRGVEGADVQTAVARAGEELARDGLTWAALSAIPLLALALRLLYRRRGFYLVDHIIFATHTGTFLLLLTTMLWLGQAVAEGTTMAEGALFVASAGALLVYLFLSLLRVYGDSWQRTVFKGTAVAALLGVATLASIMAVMLRSDDIRQAQRDRTYALYRHAATLYSAGDSAAFRRLAPAAITEFERLPYGTADSHARYHLAELQLWAGRAEAARQTLEAVLAQEPDNPLLLGLAGRAAERAGNDSLAGEYHARLRAIDPHDPSPGWERRAHSDVIEQIRAELQD